MYTYLGGAECKVDCLLTVWKIKSPVIIFLTTISCLSSADKSAYNTSVATKRKPSNLHIQPCDVTDV